MYAARPQGDMGNFMNKFIQISSASLVRNEKKTLRQIKKGTTRNLNVGDTSVSIRCDTSQLKNKARKPQQWRLIYGTAKKTSAKLA